MRARTARLAGASAERAPTDGLVALSTSALFVKLVAAALRFIAACAVSFAGLLVLALFLASFERTGGEEPVQTSASAYLDFDLSVLRALADRSLTEGSGEDVHRASLDLWQHRPDWQLPRAAAESPRLVGPGDAWAAVASQNSRFRTAARGAVTALPFLLAGLLLSLLAAASGAALVRLRDDSPPRYRRFARVAAIAGFYLLVVQPLLPLLDADVFYDRTHSLGLGLSAALFVGAFAGTLSGAAARAFFANGPSAQHLTAIGGRRALFTVARLAALDAVSWLVPLVPALAIAAVFVCAKADQDAGASGPSSGLGALIRAAMAEPSIGERVASCALASGALVVLWYLGHRFVLEVRESLGAQRSSA